MRELNQEELDMVFGGDGIVIPGGGYISTTRNVFNLTGAYGAASLAGTVGYGVGTLINKGIEHSFGGNAGDALWEMGLRS